MELTSEYEAKSRRKIARRIKVDLIQRGIPIGDLAKILGYSPQYIQNVVCGACPADRCRPARKAIEDFLGTPFWSDPREFYERRPEPTPTTDNYEKPKQA